MQSGIAQGPDRGAAHDLSLYYSNSKRPFTERLDREEHRTNQGFSVTSVVTLLGKSPEPEADSSELLRSRACLSETDARLLPSS